MAIGNLGNTPNNRQEGLYISPPDPTQIEILKDAVWSLQHGESREVTWVNQNGEKLQSRAISGEVQIIVDPAEMSPAEVKTLVSQNGGTIFAQLPAAGLYWAKVDLPSRIPSRQRSPRPLAYSRSSFVAITLTIYTYLPSVI
ncbi:hypothetical protein ACFLUO_08065 [Chloroflexota bacterium]